jgi:superkiller protein 3
MAQEKTADYWLKKGQELDINGSYNESIQTYYKALNSTNETLKKNPKDAAAWQTKGLILERLYRFNESAIAFGKVVELNPKNAEAWLHEGKALDLNANMLQGQERTNAFEDAIKAFDKAIEINPNYGEAWKDKGYYLGSLAVFNKNLRNYNESLNAFDKAIQLMPANDTRNLALAWDGRANTLVGLGNTLNDSGKLDEARGKREEALNDYSKAIELDRNFTGLEARLYSAGVLGDLGRYSESVAAYDKVIETMPANDTMYAAIVWGAKGSVLEKMGEHAEALKAFDKALELNPSDTIAMQGRGNALMALGRQPEADAAFAKAKELGYNTSNVVQEKTADYWLEKGHVLERNGSYEEAVQAYDRAIDLEPNNATLYIAKVPSLNLLAVITNNQSKCNESMEAVNKAFQIDSKNPSAWELKGEVFSQMKRYNESLEAYDKAIENIGSYRQDSHLNQTEFLSYIWTSRSISLWQLMRYNESLEGVDKAVQIDPSGNFDSWAFKGQLLASIGRYNESLQAFDKAAAIGTANNRPELEALPWIDEGYVLMDMGRYEEADLLYKKIIGLNFTDEGSNRQLADAWRGRGNALASLGKYNESLQAFEKAIELNSEKAPYAWTGKGDALLASGRYDEALKAYDRALKLYPEFADAGIAHAQKGKGDSLTSLGKSKEALAAYGAAVGASDKAITAFNNATALDKAMSFTFDPYPLDVNFWNNRGSILKTLGRQNEADAAFAKAKELGYQR